MTAGKASAEKPGLMMSISAAERRSTERGYCQIFARSLSRKSENRIAKNGAHFVEDVRVREDQMVDGVIVAEDAERAAGRAQDERRLPFSLKPHFSRLSTITATATATRLRNSDFV